MLLVVKTNFSTCEHWRIRNCNKFTYACQFISQTNHLKVVFAANMYWKLPKIYSHIYYEYLSRLCSIVSKNPNSGLAKLAVLHTRYIKVTFTSQRSIFIDKHYHIIFCIYWIRKYMSFKAWFMVCGYPKHLRDWWASIWILIKWTEAKNMIVCYKLKWYKFPAPWLSKIFFCDHVVKSYASFFNKFYASRNLFLNW